MRGESAGYGVIEAREGAEALKKVEKHKGSIELLVRNIVVPGMMARNRRGAYCRIARSFALPICPATENGRP